MADRRRSSTRQPKRFAPATSAFLHEPGSFLKLDRKLVDLGGQDEIVLRQPADGVRRKFDRHIAVTGQVQVGVMVLGLGDVADSAEKVEGGGKILYPPFPAKAFAVGTHSPLWHGRLQLFDVIGCQRRDAALAGLAFLFSERSGGGSTHAVSPFRGRRRRGYLSNPRRRDAMQGEPLS